MSGWDAKYQYIFYYPVLTPWYNQPVGDLACPQLIFYVYILTSKDGISYTLAFIINRSFQDNSRKPDRTMFCSCVYNETE